MEHGRTIERERIRKGSEREVKMEREGGVDLKREKKNESSEKRDEYREKGRKRDRVIRERKYNTVMTLREQGDNKSR